MSIKFKSYDIEKKLILVFYSLIVFTVFSEVVRRFVFNYSSVWGEEVSRYSFIYLAWLGVSLGVKNRSHIRIDVILNFIPTRLKALFYIFSDLLTLTLAIFIIWLSFDAVVNSIKFGSVTHGLRIGQYWFLFAVPFGFILITFRTIQSLIRDVKDFKNNKPVFEGHQLVD